MWIWAYWSYSAQESSWCKVGITAYLAAGGLLASYLDSFFFFPSSREKISQRELNRQPFRSEVGISPLSYGSLGSSQTLNCTKTNVVTCVGCTIITYQNVSKFLTQTWAKFGFLIGSMEIRARLIYYTQHPNVCVCVVCVIIWSYTVQ